MRVNQWLNPLNCGTGSNLVDMGRAAAHAYLGSRKATLKPLAVGGQEAMGKACGVPMARLQRNSWTPIPSIGSW